MYKKFKRSFSSFIFTLSLWLILGVTFIYLLGYLSTKIIRPVETQVVFSESDHSVWFFGLLLILTFFPFSILAGRFIAGKWLQIKWTKVIFYMGMMMFWACLLEICIDSIFVELIGRPAWLYHVWPEHSGFTSGISPVVWPWYGFHVYILHESIKRRFYEINYFKVFSAIVFAIDAMLMEALVNTFSLLFFGSFYFYYLSPEFFHVTALEIFVPYVLCGFLIMAIVNLSVQRKWPMTIMGVIAYFLGILLLYY